tara:strand:+ start:167 stop:361 length:195 start_codon:yes stop_codon:yes gene_type:complete
MEGWYGDLARWNPLTWVIDWTRALTVEGFSWSNLGKAVGIVSIISALGVSTAIRQLRRRLAAIA